MRSCATKVIIDYLSIHLGYPWAGLRSVLLSFSLFCCTKMAMAGVPLPPERPVRLGNMDAERGVANQNRDTDLKVSALVGEALCHEELTQQLYKVHTRLDLALTQLSALSSPEGTI